MLILYSYLVYECNKVATLLRQALKRKLRGKNHKYCFTAENVSQLHDTQWLTRSHMRRHNNKIVVLLL